MEELREGVERRSSVDTTAEFRYGSVMVCFVLETRRGHHRRSNKCDVSYRMKLSIRKYGVLWPLRNQRVLRLTASTACLAAPTDFEVRNAW